VGEEVTDWTLERTEMIKRALEYFELKLNELVEPKDQANDVNSLLLEDIRSNTHKLSQAYTLVSTGNIEKSIHEYRTEVCSALLTYVAGLESSKKMLVRNFQGLSLVLIILTEKSSWLTN
jgi:hypothetical protein